MNISLIKQFEILETGNLIKCFSEILKYSSNAFISQSLMFSPKNSTGLIITFCLTATEIWWKLMTNKSHCNLSSWKRLSTHDWIYFRFYYSFSFPLSAGLELLFVMALALGFIHYFIFIFCLSNLLMKINFWRRRRSDK